jgi:glycosyltransferase involved in cell wall biosynthesis
VRIALLALGHSASPGEIDPQVAEVARAVVRHGAEVDVVTQQSHRPRPSVDDTHGVVVRYAPLARHVPFARVSALSRFLRGAGYDLVHAHGAEALLAVGLRRGGPRRLLFTPDSSFRRLVRGPYGLPTRSVLTRSAGVICASAAEADLLGRLVPSMKDRVAVVPRGVDVAAIRSATPVARSGAVVVSVTQLERRKRPDRAIAALAGLPAEFELVVVGAGTARRSLEWFADDLALGRRVRFVGPRPTAEVQRWLRTARVVVALSPDEASGSALLEAIAAGAPVVASDVPVYREAAAHVGNVGVTLLPPNASPLAIADAIAEAALVALPVPGLDWLPSHGDVAERMVAIYNAVVIGRPLITAALGDRQRAGAGKALPDDHADPDLVEAVS